MQACVQDVLTRFVAKHGTNWELLPEKAMFQMNDTHPTIAVAELMRLLVDEHKLPWETAKFTTIKCLAFTNHTVMPEALERWPFEVMTELLPRHAQIIERLDLEWCAAMSSHCIELWSVDRLDRIIRCVIEPTLLEF
jgi:glycogen phosphorylase